MQNELLMGCLAFLPCERLNLDEIKFSRWFLEEMYNDEDYKVKFDELKNKYK